MNGHFIENNVDNRKRKLLGTTVIKIKPLTQVKGFHDLLTMDKKYLPWSRALHKKNRTSPISRATRIITLL